MREYNTRWLLRKYQISVVLDLAKPYGLVSMLRVFYMPIRLDESSSLASVLVSCAEDTGGV
jgi:hypothetical protein